MSENNQCPLVEWYSFKVACTIKTCKNNTIRLSTGCLGLEHRFAAGDKIITDSEILLYKFYRTPINARGVAALRKKTLTQVKHTLVLSEFIEYLDETIAENDKVFVYLPGTSKAVDKAIAKSPLRFKRLGYKQWMLPYLTHPGVWSDFVKAKSVDRKVKHSDIFLLRPKEHKDFISAVHSLGKKKSSLKYHHA